MQLHYTRLEYGSYEYRLEWWDPETGEDHLLEPKKPEERSQMITSLCGCILLNPPKQVEIFIEGSKTPLCLNHQTVQDIADGKRKPQDLTFGVSQYTPYTKMREAVSRWFVLRPMPGQQDMFECPACGRGAHLEGSLHCDKCGLTFITSAKYWGVSADLLDSLFTNKDRDRYYIDRPWNAHPPWMSREVLTKTLGLYTDVVRAFSEE